MTSLTGRPRLICLLVFGLVVACWVLTFRPQHDWGGDFSLFVAHARNIATGRPYGDVRFFLDPEVNQLSPPAYPPLLPLFLAPVYAIWGLNYGVMKVVVQLQWLVAGYLLWLLARRRGLSPVWSAVVASVFLLGDPILRVKSSILSEGLYTALSLAVLLLVDRVYERKLDTSRPVFWGIVTGAVIGLAYLSRVTALALALSFAICELWRFRRIRTYAVAAGLTVVAVLLAYKLLFVTADYGSQFRLTPAVWVANLIYYTKAPASIWTAAPAVLRYPLGVGLLLLGAAGLLMGWSRRVTLAEPLLLVSVLPVVMYSQAPTIRYVVPVLPLLLIFAAEALRRMLDDYGPQRWTGTAMTVLATGLLALGVLNARNDYRQPPPDGPANPSFLQLTQWMKQHVGASDITASWNPRVLALYTDLPQTYYVWSDDQQRFDSFVQRVRIEWVVTFTRADDDNRWLLPRLEARPDLYHRVWSSGDFTVWRTPVPGR